METLSEYVTRIVASTRNARAAVSLCFLLLSYGASLRLALEIGQLLIFLRFVCLLKPSVPLL
ncbi:MAG: hypothetical protein WBV94_07535 [Blastocatellia bacterium]